MVSTPMKKYKYIRVGNIYEKLIWRNTVRPENRKERKKERRKRRKNNAEDEKKKKLLES